MPAGRLGSLLSFELCHLFMNAKVDNNFIAGPLDRVSVDGTLVPAHRLAASGVKDAVVLLPAAAADDFLSQLQFDEALQGRVRAVLVESGASLSPAAC